MQPPTWIRSESSGLKQLLSSTSFLLLSPSAGFTHLPWTLAWPQYSKWPISSAKATLYEWAAHGTRVCSLEVEYIGWKAYGVCVHVDAVGSKLTWAKPLATLAVIEPVSPLVTSSMATTRPAAESWIDRLTWSPLSMNRSVAGFGVNVARVWSSGPAGACGAPLIVMNAKFAGSMPTVFRQSVLLLTPAFWSLLKLKIATAAHHLVASQLMASVQLTQPGGEHCTARTH